MSSFSNQTFHKKSTYVVPAAIIETRNTSDYRAGSHTSRPARGRKVAGNEAQARGCHEALIKLQVSRHGVYSPYNTNNITLRTPHRQEGST